MEYLPLIGMVLVFYFLMIRPQAKKANAQKGFTENLSKGDEVVTDSGLIGKISKIEDNIVTIQTGQKNYVRFFRGSISGEKTAILQKVNTGEVVDTNVAQ